jgi:UPF0755 protein
MLLVAGSLGVGAVGIGLWLWGSDSKSLGELHSDYVRFEVREGESLDSLARRLQDLGMVDRDAMFTWYKRLYASESTLEAGGHWLPRGASARELVALLARRQTRAKARVTFPEGWDSFQMAQRVADRGICAAVDFLALVHDANSARAWIEQSSFEGYLFPSTYQFSLNSDPKDVVFRMVDEGQRQRATVLGAEPSTRGGWLTSEHEVVTLASVIQKESASQDEMPLIASVFRNRLLDPQFKPRGALQSDPTAGYGCKLPDAPPSCADYDGKITPAMLRDPKNRYNTYRHAGLPPGPIGNPGVDALRAASSPAKTPYYFFVLGPDGKHRFSATFVEHRRAIDPGGGD